MPSQDPAKAVKAALEEDWGTTHPTWTPTLHVDDDYLPVAGSPALLVADDGNTRLVGDAWALRQTPRRVSLRLTGIAKGRDEARTVLDTAVDYVLTHRPAAISRIEDVPDPLVTRDRGTGAFLASITMPVIVKPVSE